MAGNGKKSEHEALAEAISRALAPQFVGLQTEFRSQIGQLREELRGELVRTNERLDRTNEGLDRLVENTGAHYRQLEERVTRLEDRLFREG